MVDLYAGHILPGTGYLIYALWWSLTTSIRFARSMNDDGGKNRPTSSYKTSVAMPALFLPKSVPAFLRHPAFESCFRFACSLVGLIYHPVDAYIDYTKAVKGDIIPAFSNIGDRWDLIYRVEHHFSLYLAFAIASFIEIIIHIGVPLPRKLDRAMLIMSYSFEAFIFSNHFNGRMSHSIDVALHTHLAFAVYGCALFCILEAYDDRQVLFTYGRCLFTALQGTWFFQIAASLYLPFQSISFLRWDVNNLDLVPEVTTYFCIHFFFIFIFLFAQMCIVQVIYRRRLHLSKRRRSLTNGYKYRLRLSSSMSSSSDEAAIYERYHVDA